MVQNVLVSESVTWLSFISWVPRDDDVTCCTESYFLWTDHVCFWRSIVTWWQVVNCVMLCTM